MNAGTLDFGPKLTRIALNLTYGRPWSPRAGSRRVTANGVPLPWPSPPQLVFSNGTKVDFALSQDGMVALPAAPLPYEQVNAILDSNSSRVSLIDSATGDPWGHGALRRENGAGSGGAGRAPSLEDDGFVIVANQIIGPTTGGGGGGGDGASLAQIASVVDAGTTETTTAVTASTADIKAHVTAAVAGISTAPGGMVAPPPDPSDGAYGGWSEQRVRSGHDAMGRYSPAMVRRDWDDAIGGWVYNINVVYDRAEKRLLERLNADSVEPNAVVEGAWLTGAWAGPNKPVATTVWECDLKLPAKAGIGFALMLWADESNGSIWPTGEINVAEGMTGSGKFITNLHWGATEAEHQHAPQDHMVELGDGQWHRFKCEVQQGVIRFYMDGNLIRTLNSAEVPHQLNMHWVIQCAAAPSVIGHTYPSDFWFWETVSWRDATWPTVPTSPSGGSVDWAAGINALNGV